MDDVRLGLRHAIHRQHPILHSHGIARDTHDTLDIVRPGIRRRPEQNDVAALRMLERGQSVSRERHFGAISELVDQQKITDEQRLFHAARRNPDPFNEERAQHEEQREGDHERLRPVPDHPPPESAAIRAMQGDLPPFHGERRLTGRRSDTRRRAVAHGALMGAINRPPQTPARRVRARFGTRQIAAKRDARDGIGLSQGQRQLLNIARAAVAGPPILILDEATSSIDTRTELQIQMGMDRLMQGRTSFVIAHRLSTVRNADEILVLEGGVIVERGNHEALLQQKGKYYALYATQFD